MRRAAVVAVVGLGSLLLMAGCQLPAGVDGDLTGDWQGLPAPTAWVPVAGACHAHDYQESVTLDEYDPVDCDQAHPTQTVFVGELTGSAADRGGPPDPGSPGWQEAFQVCDEGSQEFLGANYRHGPLVIGVVVPSEQAWEGGARWVRCDVTHEDGEDLTESLADGLEPGAELAFGCYVAELNDEDRVTDIVDTPCDEPHDVEFVGVYLWDGASFPDDFEPLHDGCREKVAEFADVPVDDDLTARTGTIVIRMDEDEFALGDQGVRCYLWLDYEAEESKRGVGENGLPTT